MAHLEIGDTLIPFRLSGTDGRTHTPDDYADRAALVLIFSCNHCPYVRAWEDRMIQLQHDYGSKGVQLLAIHANDAQKYPADSFANMQQRVKEKGFPFPFLHDESQEIAHAYGATRTPEIFLFDQNRTLRYHGAIDDSYDDPVGVKQPYVRNALDAVLAGQSPLLAETPSVGCTIKWK